MGKEFLFAHENSDFSAVSLTERNAARDRFLCHSLAQCEQKCSHYRVFSLT